MPECVLKGRCRKGRNNSLVTALHLLSLSATVSSALQQPGYTHLRSPFPFPAAHLEQQQQQKQQDLSSQLHTCTSLQGPACLYLGNKPAVPQAATESLLASGLLPQRNGTKGGQMKLQLLRMPVGSAGSIEELFMQFTSQEAESSGQNGRDAPKDTSDGAQSTSHRQSVQGFEKSGSEVLYEADEASLQDLERVVEALSGHIGISSAGNFAETLRQTLAGLLTDAEMAAAGLLLDQGPASSFQGGPVIKGSSSGSSSGNPKPEASPSDAAASMPQGEHTQAAHHQGRDPGSDNTGRGSLESDTFLQNQHHQQQQQQQQQPMEQQLQHPEQQPKHAGIHHQQPSTNQDAPRGQHDQSLQHEHNAALRATLARISSSRLASQSQSEDHLAASEEVVSELSASPAMAQMEAGLDSTGAGKLSGSMLDHEDDDWLDEPFAQPSEEDLQFEAEAIADMVREANLTALAQQLQSLYDEHEWAEEYE